MKLLCQGLDLSVALNKVQKALASKSINPILEGIKLTAHKNTLTVRATDLELSIENTIKADVVLEGEIVITGKLFHNFVSRLSHTQVELSAIGTKLAITYMDNKMEFSLLNAEEYPASTSTDNANHFTITASALKNLINKTAFSASSEDSRPILKGCFMEVDKAQLTMVALDGYRMSVAKAPITKVSKNLSLVVPARSLKELANLLEGDSEVIVTITRNHLVVDLVHTKVVTRLLEGEYLNYKKILPTSAETTLTLNKNSFNDSLDRAYVLASGDRNNRVRFSTADNILTITSNSDFANIKEVLPVVIEGVDITISFNAKYFTEALKVADHEYMQILFEGPSKPAILKPDKDNSYLFLILAVRVS